MSITGQEKSAYRHLTTDGVVHECASVKTYQFVVVAQYPDEGHERVMRWSQTRRAANAFRDYITGPACLPCNARVEPINNGVRS